MSATVPLIFDDCEQGGKPYSDDDEGGIENDFAYRNNVVNASQSIRMGFIRKVFALLSLQLILTIVVAATFLFTPQIKSFVHSNDWMLLLAFFGSLILLLFLHVKRKETPTNFILLIAFTLTQAYTIGVVVTYYSQAVVLQALILTFTVLLGLTIFTFQTKRDFSSLHASLFAGLCILLVGGVLQIFFSSTILEVALSFGGAFLFSLFIVFDLQLIMKTLSAEEYILATINLYLDIVNLFLYILRILQALNKQ